MTKILITGATGFLGSNFSKYYIDKGYTVVGTGTKPEENISLKGLSEYKQLILPDDHLYDLIKKYKPDICIHCAGSSSVMQSVENPQRDFDINVPVTFHLLEGLRKYSPDCKTVIMSSAAVYGNPAYLPINEIHPVRPISPYGFHKMLCENICFEYSQLYDLKINIIRIFSAYGPGLQKQILWDIYNKGKNEDPLLLSGTGQETRDFVYIEDIINAVDVILKNPTGNFEIFNIASGEETSIQKLAELMLDELKFDIKIEFNGKSRKGDPTKWKTDISKLKSLGFKPNYSIEKGVQNYCQWVKSEFNDK